MGIIYNTAANGCQSQSNCIDKLGCPSGRCPDFIIKRHDTRPSLQVYVNECDGPLDTQGLVVEANMWAAAKLRAAVAVDDTSFRLADDIGFEQIAVGDTIVMRRARSPEYMTVTGFDEDNKLVQVTRGTQGTTACAWKKGSQLRIYRVMSAPARKELKFEDIENLDGTTDKNVLTDSYFIYDWQANDTCLPGCYWFEFVLMKMQGLTYFLPGGNWAGEVHAHTDGFYYTGMTHTDSSVKLSYDTVNELYLISDDRWTGPVYLVEDVYFTGTFIDDGSMPLTKTGVAANYDTEIKTLTNSSSPCDLPVGVEWIRRFPVDSSGYLIRIEDTVNVA